MEFPVVRVISMNLFILHVETGAGRRTPFTTHNSHITSELVLQMPGSPLLDNIALLNSIFMCERMKKFMRANKSNIADEDNGFSVDHWHGMNKSVIILCECESIYKSDLAFLFVWPRDDVIGSRMLHRCCNCWLCTNGVVICHFNECKRISYKFINNLIPSRAVLGKWHVRRKRIED